MSLLELLQGLGGRLGILEMTGEPSSPATMKMQTRSVTLAELTSEVRSKEIRALAELPAELAVPFDKIIEAAGIKPQANGWNIERLRQLLHTDAFKGKDHDEVQRAVLNVLHTGNVDVQALVKDAMARDQALDSYEAAVRNKMDERIAAHQRKIGEIQSRIAVLQGELASEKDKTEVDEAKWREWKKLKRAQEQDLARTISYLIDKQVVSIDEE